MLRSFFLFLDTIVVCCFFFVSRSIPSCYATAINECDWLRCAVCRQHWALSHASNSEHFSLHFAQSTAHTNSHTHTDIICVWRVCEWVRDITSNRIIKMESQNDWISCITNWMCQVDGKWRLQRGTFQWFCYGFLVQFAWTGIEPIAEHSSPCICNLHAQRFSALLSNPTTCFVCELFCR